MTDTRVRIPLDKPVTLDVLDAALGGHGLCASETEIVAVEGSPVALAELQAAYDAHIPAPAPATDAEKIAELVDAVSVLTDITFTLMGG